MDLTTVLNRCHRFRSFVYGKSCFKGQEIHVEVRPRKGSQPVCSKCDRRGAVYDTARRRRAFAFVPLWGFAVFLGYCMRRVDCQRCGVTIERVPWADGKNRMCNVYRLFLARWARRLSWSEVALIFHTSWGVVHRAIGWVVAYGLAHRSLDVIRAIGVDEIAVWAGHKYLTVVYQIDAAGRRLLWVGAERTTATLNRFFEMLGEVRAQALQFVASDMWKPYLDVIRKRAKQATHVLDRFHIVKQLNEAVDQVRAKEARELAREGFHPVLKHTRWCFLKRPENLTNTQQRKLWEVLRYDLRSVRAYLLKESFDAFWSYASESWAGSFLDLWCKRAMRSRLEPIKKFVGTLRRHRPLILNWFKARNEIAAGAVEGLNANAKLAVRKARGFRTYEVLEVALYHELGRLPEPTFTHSFC